MLFHFDSKVTQITLSTVQSCLTQCHHIADENRLTADNKEKFLVIKENMTHFIEKDLVLTGSTNMFKYVTLLFLLNCILSGPEMCSKVY